MKPKILSEKPFGKNSPTDKTYIYSDKDDLNFEEEKAKFKQSVNQFFEGGVAECTIHTHPFFGEFTPGTIGHFLMETP